MSVVFLYFLRLVSLQALFALCLLLMVGTTQDILELEVSFKVRI